MLHWFINYSKETTFWDHKIFIVHYYYPTLTEQIEYLTYVKVCSKINFKTGEKNMNINVKTLHWVINLSKSPAGVHELPNGLKFPSKLACLQDLCIKTWDIYYVASKQVKVRFFRPMLSDFPNGTSAIFIEPYAFLKSINRWLSGWISRRNTIPSVFRRWQPATTISQFVTYSSQSMKLLQMIDRWQQEGVLWLALVY